MSSAASVLSGLTWARSGPAALARIRRRRKRATPVWGVLFVLAAMAPTLGIGALAQPAAAAAAAVSGAAVYNFGDAQAYGSTYGQVLDRPVVSAQRTVTGDGYWEVASDGGIFSFGGAAFYGSTGNIKLAQPIVGMAATPSGHGYWMVASDGGIFTFGDAAFYGSTGNIKLAQPIVGMAATPSGHGYWMVASDGGIFTFGDAAFYGSTGNIKLAQPIVGMAATPSGHGYWLSAADGGVFTFGDAPYVGRAFLFAPGWKVFALFGTVSGHGYWQVAGPPQGTSPPQTAPQVAALVGTWEHHGALLVIKPDGGFTVAARSYYPCANTPEYDPQIPVPPGVPCEDPATSFAEHASGIITAFDGATATGLTRTSNYAPAWPVGPTTMQFLPQYDTILETWPNGGSLAWCGLNAPTTPARDELYCGA
jgi:hypothetical protein